MHNKDNDNDVMIEDDNDDEPEKPKNLTPIRSNNPEGNGGPLPRDRKQNASLPALQRSADLANGAQSKRPLPINVSFTGRPRGKLLLHKD